ncbi:unnamed protein product [Cyprideis torosa]|uniref:Uncharacterized protein n=1 Tax=Cyprideis torosa TaxID=163714 RepID=A0A7R8WEK5_9CRUS|nr:unnamed protein product [Cyprideis torosa]CAG0893030.1 unnamed protein product [Cyprideis torosa]
MAVNCRRIPLSSMYSEQRFGFVGGFGASSKSSFNPRKGERCLSVSHRCLSVSHRCLSVNHRLRRIDASVRLAWKRNHCGRQIGWCSQDSETTPLLLGWSMMARVQGQRQNSAAVDSRGGLIDRARVQTIPGISSPVTFGLEESQNEDIDGLEFFRIDSRTGKIYLNKSLEDEGGKTFYLYVTATSGSLTSKVEVQVEVEEDDLDDDDDETDSDGVEDDLLISPSTFRPTDKGMALTEDRRFGIDESWRPLCSSCLAERIIVPSGCLPLFMETFCLEDPESVLVTFDPSDLSSASAASS